MDSIDSERHVIRLKRLQFPVWLAFAMSIDKFQGQSLSVCSINVENPCFSHGQLYVAFSVLEYQPNYFYTRKKKN
jgi:hypothetical protein